MTCRLGARAAESARAFRHARPISASRGISEIGGIAHHVSRPAMPETLTENEMSRLSTNIFVALRGRSEVSCR